MRHRRKGQIAAGRMHDPLGLAGRSRGVKDEQRVLGIHRARRAVGADLLHHRQHVDIAAIDPGGLIAGMLDHQAAHPVRAMQQRGVGIGFQPRAPAAARGGIGGDDQFRARIVDAVGQRIRREAGKDDGMDRPDPRAGQHRIGGLGDHRQIDHHPVAAHDALRQQDIGHPVHLFRQLGIGDMARGRVRVIGFKDDRGLVGAGRQMPVDAVHAGIQHAVLEPFDRDLAQGEIGVLDLGIGLDPVQPLALAAPEADRIGHRFGIETVIIRRLDMGGPETGRNRMFGKVFNGHGWPPLVAIGFHRGRPRSPQSVWTGLGNSLEAKVNTISQFP